MWDNGQKWQHSNFCKAVSAEGYKRDTGIRHEQILIDGKNRPLTSIRKKNMQMGIYLVVNKKDTSNAAGRNAGLVTRFAEGRFS